MSATKLKNKLKWSQIIIVLVFLIIVLVARFITNNLHSISFAVILFIMYFGGSSRIRRALNDSFYAQDENNLQNINRQITLMFCSGLIFNFVLLILILFR